MTEQNNTNFRKEIIEKNGDFFSTHLENFLSKAVELARIGNLDEAIKVGNDALVLAKYSNAGYAILYLVGMLCQANLEKGNLKLAGDHFMQGMEILNEKDDTYERDLNSFLDLKILIDEGYKAKS